MKSQEKMFTNKDLIRLICPLVVELLLKIIVGLIDSVMVASIGEAAVSGVSLVDSIIQVLIYIFSAMAAGGAVAAGQYLGAGKNKEARVAANDLVWLCSLCSIAIMVLTFLGADAVLNTLYGSIEADVHYYAYRYFAVIALSIPAIAIFEACTAILRTINDSKTSMKISMLMNGLNVIGNYMLIYIFPMDTAGAAISTVFARWSAAIIVLAILLGDGRELSLEHTLRHRFDRRIVKQILSLGIPNGVENGIFQLCKIVVIRIVTGFGTAAITANSIVQTLASLEVIPGSAVQLGTTTVISKNIGKGDYDGAKHYNGRLIFMSYAGIVLFTCVIATFLPQILSLYHLSLETEQLAKNMFVCHAVGALLLWPLAFNLPQSMRAAGDVRLPMIISVISTMVFRVGSAYIFSYLLGFGAVGAWIAMTVDWAFRAVIYIIRWKSGRWQNKAIV